MGGSRNFGMRRRGLDVFISYYKKLVYKREKNKSFKYF